MKMIAGLIPFTVLIPFIVGAVIQSDKLRKAEAEADYWKTQYFEQQSVHEDAIQIYKDLIDSEIQFTNENTTPIPDNDQ